MTDEYSLLPVSREPFNRDTTQGATEGTGRVFSQQESDTLFRSTLSGRDYLMIFPYHGKKDTYSLFQFRFRFVFSFDWPVGLVVRDPDC